MLHCHSPGVATVVRRHCRTPPAHRCPRQQRQRQRVIEGTAMYGPIEWAQIIEYERYHRPVGGLLCPGRRC